MTLINIQQLKDIGPEIRAMALAHGCINPRIFGSVADGSNTSFSDVDLAIDVLSKTSMFDIVDLEIALRDKFKLPFEVTIAAGLPIAWRDKALATAVPI